MLNVTSSEMREKIINSFPKQHEKDVKKVLNNLNLNEYEYTSFSETKVQLFGEEIFILERIYFDEPSSNLENNLTTIQKEILSCIFTAHHDGYIREKRVKKLLLFHSSFCIPFIFRLMGEYLIECLVPIYQKIEEAKKDDYNHFIFENKQYWILIKQRIYSYWNEFYKWKIAFDDYVGFSIIEILEPKKHFALNNNVRVKKFNGRTIAPKYIRKIENYWLLMGENARVVKELNKFGRVLIDFEDDKKVRKLDAHYIFEGKLWILESDLMLLKK